MPRLRARTTGRALAAALVLAGLLPPPVRGAPSLADQEIAAAERRAESAAASPDDYVALASAFMRKSRESGDPGYYARANAAVERALALDPNDYGALRTAPWVLLGLHDFRGALAAAERARAVEPEDWWNYGTLADACGELGDYARALQAAQRMVDLRPGLPSYARSAFLRALFGDRAGAIELLRLAVAAGSARDPEGRAWALVHLGHEYFAVGDLAAAGRAYARALDVFPDYYLALGGLGRVRAAEGRLAAAADLYRRAVARVPQPDLVAALGDVHDAAGHADEAERQYALVEYMGKVAAAAGTTYGRQLALFYADHDRRPEEALRLARLEAAGRGDIYTDDTLAWACYRNGRFAEAARAAHRALRLGTEDAMLHYHTGAIAAALGRNRIAARHLRRALALNPHFDLRQAPRARAALAALVPPAQGLELPPGAGGLPTLRLEVLLTAPLPERPGAVEFRDRNFAGRAGWQEVVADAGEGLVLADSSVPRVDRSRALRAYPADLLQSPPQVSEARLRVTTGSAAPLAPSTPAGALVGAQRFGDRMTELIDTTEPLGLGLVLTSLLVAALLGALHALGPGHGKTIVGAYLIGARGTARHALFLGLVVTVTHTLGVYLLGFATWGASAWVVPERLFPWIGVLSGLLVVAIGASLVRPPLEAP